jgi:hypothetical protein
MGQGSGGILIVKVTIAFSKAIVNFFKKEAQKYNIQYQKMIHCFLDEYATPSSANCKQFITSVQWIIMD